MIQDVQLTALADQKIGADDKDDGNEKEGNRHRKKEQAHGAPVVPEGKLQRGRHEHEPLIGHHAHQNIIREVQEHGQPADLRQRPAEHRGPEDVGDKIQNKGDDGAVEPDLLLLLGAVKDIMNQQHGQNENTDQAAFRIEDHIIRVHVPLLPFEALRREPPGIFESENCHRTLL